MISRLFVLILGHILNQHMMKKLFSFALIFVFFCQLAVAQKKKQALLAYNFKVGNKYQSEMQFAQQIAVMGQNMPQTMAFGVEFEVMAVEPNGDASLKVTYTRIKFEQDNPMGKMGYDSDSTEEPDEKSAMLAESLGKLKGKWVVMKMRKNGEMIAVTDGDEALKQAFQQQSGELFSKYPDKPVKVGKSWTSEQNRNTNGVKLNVVSTYTLKEYQNGKWIIAMNGILKDSAGKEIGTQTANIELDEADIMITKTVGDQDVKNLTVNGMTMGIKAKNTITVVKK